MSSLRARASASSTASRCADQNAAITDKDGKYSLQAPRSLVRGDRLQLKVAALGLPPTVVDVIVNAAAVTADVALTLTSEQVQVTVDRTPARKARCRST